MHILVCGVAGCHSAGSLGIYENLQKKIEENGLQSEIKLILDPETGAMAETIEDQTRQSLSNVKAILEAAGTDLAHVVKTTVFLQSMGDFAAMNGVYAEFFTENCPARSAVEVACLPKNAKVEIEAIALID